MDYNDDFDENELEALELIDEYDDLPEDPDTNENIFVDEVDDKPDEGIEIDLSLDKKYKKKKNYIDKHKFTEEVQLWADARRLAKLEGKELPVPNNFIGKCIIAIARNFASRHNFFQYTWKTEMIEDAIETVIKYLHNYDFKKALINNPEAKPNAYGYVSRFVERAFINRITEEEKQHYLKMKSFELSGQLTDLCDEPIDNLQDIGVADANALASDYHRKIYEYEAKMEAKKELIRLKIIERDKDKPVVVKVEDTYDPLSEMFI